MHFFFAAHSLRLAWLLVVLGEKPELAAALRAETDGVRTSRPAYAQVQQLPLARAVSRAVLRVYPIAPVTFFGVAKQDLKLDGLQIKAGWNGAGAICATLQDGATLRDAARARVRAAGGGLPDGHWCPGDADAARDASVPSVVRKSSRCHVVTA